MVMAPIGHVIKAEQQAGNGRFARPRRPDNGNGLPRRDIKADPLENWPICIIMKMHIHKSQPPPPSTASARASDLSFTSSGLTHQLEHGFKVHKALLDLPMHGAKEIERHGKLHQQRIDQNKIPNCLHSLHDTPGRQPPYTGPYPWRRLRFARN